MAHHPGVVALREGGYVPGVAVEFTAIGHGDVKGATDLVLEMRRFAEVGAGDGLHVRRPAPSGLEGKASDLTPTDGQEVDTSMLERSGLVRCCEVLELSYCHVPSPLMVNHRTGAGDLTIISPRVCHRLAATVASRWKYIHGKVTENPGRGGHHVRQ